MIQIELNGNTLSFNTRNELDLFLSKRRLSVDADGNIYELSGIGVIPEVLNNWFDERVEYKNLMKKYKNEGNVELAEYYDRRQHIQKIFLNSLYGVLGLPIWRFYDVDNALAVTASGQDVIKSSAKFANRLYHTRTTPRIVELEDGRTLHITPYAECTVVRNGEEFTVLGKNLLETDDLLKVGNMYI
jgi:hypothetical protein